MISVILCLATFLIVGLYYFIILSSVRYIFAVSFVIFVIFKCDAFIVVVACLCVLIILLVYLLYHPVVLVCSELLHYIILCE